METEHPASLQMPSFLYGIYPAVHQRAKREGRRCGEQYRKDGSFPPHRELRTIPPGEVVVAHEVADFARERPAWRLYMVSKVLSGLYEAMAWQNGSEVRRAYEEFCRKTAWGALYFALSHGAPMSAERVALRLKAVLRFWEPLDSVRYLFKTLNVVHTLEELMVASCDWAMDAWCPVGEASVRVRLEEAAERMAQATREDCIAAILREMPRAFAYAQNLKHRDVLADPAFLHQRLATLEPALFERMSAACTSDLLAQLIAWDRQLGVQ
jgi:hypothetical protein